MDLLKKDTILKTVSLKKKNILQIHTKHTCSLFKTEYMTYRTETRLQPCSM